jgi:CheY-like chemotaxis protein
MLSPLPVTRDRLRIALVENDPDDLFFLERALVKNGFSRPLFHCRDGAEAASYLNKLIANNSPLPDIILTDIKMPRMNGIDLLGFVRQSPQLKEIPVIILTSSSEHSDMRQTARLGVFKFLTKEVCYEKVVSTLDLFIISLNHDLRKGNSSSGCVLPQSG